MFIIVLVVFFLIFFIGLRGTVFGVSLATGNLAGLLLARELIFLVLLGVVLLELLGLNAFNVFYYVEADSVYWISWFIVYSLFVFLFVLISLSRTRLLKLSFVSSVSFEGLQKLYFFGFYLSFVLTISLLVLFFVFDYKHAFLGAILGDSSLKELRMYNKYKVEISSVFVNFVSFVTVFLAIVMGASSFDRRILVRGCSLSLVLLSASASGEKAPILNVLIIYVLSYSSFHTGAFTIGRLLKTIIVGFAFLIFLILVVYMQFPDYTAAQYGSYFFNRLGVGQISGVYEQFNLELRGDLYVFHAIPFASQFVDYIPFQKDLMVVTEDVKNANSTGVKNSLFISEALAIGGWWLAIISPFIVALNFALSYFFLSRLTLFFLISDRFILDRICPLLFLSISPLTGGFSEWLFFKLAIMYALLILVLVVPFTFGRQLYYRIFKSHARHDFGCAECRGNV